MNKTYKKFFNNNEQKHLKTKIAYFEENNIIFFFIFTSFGPNILFLLNKIYKFQMSSKLEYFSNKTIQFLSYLGIKMSTNNF